MAGVSTNVMVLGIVSLLTDMSSEMIYPILPLFLTGIGATGLIIGLIEGAAETTASLVKVLSGWYSDKFNKRKRFIFAGYSLSAATKPFLALVTNYWQVLGIRMTERIGKGIRSAPRDALIADSTTPDNRGKAFGFHKAMDSTGAVLGPLLALPVLLTAAVVTTDTYRLIFLLSAIPAFAAVAVIVLFVREKETKTVRRPSKFVPELRRMGRRYWALMMVVAVFFLGEVSYAFFVLKAQDIGLSDVDIILFYVLFNLTFVVLAIPSGSLSDRIGRKPVIALSFLMFACTCAVMALADRWWVLGLGFVLFGIYKGSSEGVLKALVTDIAPSELRATALGGYHTIMGLVMLPGGLIAGLLWDSFGDWATFTFGIVTSAIALTMILGLSSLKGASSDNEPRTGMISY